MWWIKSGIENTSKSKVNGRCGGDEKTNDHAEMSNAKFFFIKIQLFIYKCSIKILQYLIPLKGP